MLNSISMQCPPTIRTCIRNPTPIPVEFWAVLNTMRRARWKSHRWEINFEELDAELFGPEPDAQTPCDHQSEEIHGWVVHQGDIGQELRQCDHDIRRAYGRQRIFREDQTELLVSSLGTSSDNEG
jgi:hypothetical protein